MHAQQKMSLHDAIYSPYCSVRTIRKTVRKNPVSLNSINEDGKSPLHIALLRKKPIELIHQLLKLGADVNLFSGYDKTPLHFAVMSFYKHEALLDVIKLLIKFGANVNLKETYHHTPVHYLLKNVEGSTLLRALDIFLKNGVDTNHVSGNFDSYLEYAFSNIRELNNVIEVSKMLLEFGVEPDKHMHQYDLNFKKEKRSLSLQFVKLLMQYVFVKEMKIGICKEKGLNLQKEYDEIFNLKEFSKKKIFKELIEYRNCLIKELSKMKQDKLDKKVTLFSFVSERCSSGHYYDKNEEPLLHKIISIVQSNSYVCCNDILRASIKHEALMSVISKTCIDTEESVPDSSFKTKVILKGKSLLKIASYLTRQDVLNLTLAYWIPVEQNGIVPGKNRKRTKSKNIGLNKSSKTLNKRQKLKK